MDEYTREYRGQTYRIVSTLNYSGTKPMYHVQEPVMVRRWFRKRVEWAYVGINPRTGFRDRGKPLPYLCIRGLLPYPPKPELIRKDSIAFAEQCYHDAIDLEMHSKKLDRATAAYGVRLVPRTQE